MRIGDAAVVDVVAHNDELLVGYALAAHHDAQFADGHWAIETVVDPHHEAQSTVMIELVRTLRAGLPANDVVTVWGWRDGEVAAAHAERWEQVRVLHQMMVELPLEAPSAVPDGVHIRPFVVGVDEEAWLLANALAFSRHPENGAVDRENLRRRMAQDWFDPAGFLLAWRGETLVGFCWTKLHPQRIGEIYIIGVIPAASGHGLGSALLNAGLHDLWVRQGARRGMLYVGGDDDRALDLYHRFGFEVTFTLCEFEVPPASQGAAAS